MEEKRTLVMMNGLKNILYVLNIYQISEKKIKKMNEEEEEKFLKVFKINLLTWFFFLLAFTLFTYYFTGLKVLISISTGIILGFTFWALVYDILPLIGSIIVYFVSILVIGANIFFLNIIPFAYSFLFLALTFTGFNLLFFYKNYSEDEVYKYDDGFWCIKL
jgi:hypothetical protein